MRKKRRFWQIFFLIISIFAVFCIATSAATGTDQSYTADLSTVSVSYALTPSTTQVAASYNATMQGLYFNNGGMDGPYNDSKMMMFFEVSTNASDFVFKEGNQYNITVQWSGAYSNSSGIYESLSDLPTLSLFLIDASYPADVRTVPVSLSNSSVRKVTSPNSGLSGVATLDVYTLTYTMSGTDLDGLSLMNMVLSVDFSKIESNVYFIRQFIYEVTFNGWTNEDYPIYGWTPTPSAPEGSEVVGDLDQAEQELFGDIELDSWLAKYENLTAEGSLLMESYAGEFAVLSKVFNDFFVAVPDFQTILYLALTLGIFGLITGIGYHLIQSRRESVTRVEAGAGRKSQLSSSVYKPWIDRGKGGRNKRV